MKKTKDKQTRAKKKVAIKDLPTRAARDEAVRGGADPINSGKIKKS